MKINRLTLMSNNKTDFPHSENKKIEQKNKQLDKRLKTRCRYG